MVPHVAGAGGAQPEERGLLCGHTNVSVPLEPAAAFLDFGAEQRFEFSG